MIHLALECKKAVGGTELEGDFDRPSQLDAASASEMLEFAVDQMTAHHVILSSEIDVTDELCHIKVLFEEDEDFDAKTTTGLLESYFNDYLRDH